MPTQHFLEQGTVRRTKTRTGYEIRVQVKPEIPTPTLTAAIKGSILVTCLNPIRCVPTEADGADPRVDDARSGESSLDNPYASVPEWRSWG